MNKDYLNILKPLSVFGGAQMLRLVLSLGRIKLLAWCLGAAGYGLTALYSQTLSFFVLLFGWGMTDSIVKLLGRYTSDISTLGLRACVSVYRKLLWLCAGGGAVVVFLCSGVLFRAAPAAEGSPHAFRWLAPVVLFSVLSTGNHALLTGLKQTRLVALNMVLGSAAMLLVMAPMLWVYRWDGIVGALVVSAGAEWLVSWGCLRKSGLPSASLSWRQIYMYARRLFVLGLPMLSVPLLGSLFTTLFYQLMARWGSTSLLGVYAASMVLLTQGTSVFFVGMYTDLYPRLSSLVARRSPLSSFIARQQQVVVSLFPPFLCVVMAVLPWLIPFVTGSDFGASVPVVRVLCVGMLLKGLAYPLGYVAFAKADKRVVWWVEGVYGSVATFVLSVAGFWCGGLLGVSVAFVLDFILYYLLLLLLSRRRYYIRFPGKALRWQTLSFGGMLLLLCLSFVLSSHVYAVVALLGAALFALAGSRRLFGT